MAVSLRPPLSKVIPSLILGTATFNTQHVRDPLQMPYRQIVSRAFELGVNGFDTSPYYGPSEVLLGEALEAHVTATQCPRESYVLITKAGRIKQDEFDYSPEHVRHSIRRSLERLRSTYLDLVYMHDVEFVSPAEVVAAVTELRQLRDEGLIRYVGISGFPVHVLCKLAETITLETGEPLDAVLSYGHFTIQNRTLGLPEVLGRQALDSPLSRFKAAGVQVVLNASMLGMGLLTSRGIPLSTDGSDTKGSVLAQWHPSPPGLRTACKQLAALAENAGESLESVAIRWSLGEWARIGSLADVGVEVPGYKGGHVGASVMGVASVAELEETIREWNEILQSLTAEDAATAKSTGTVNNQKQEKVVKLVEDTLWPALGEWKDYAWASPEEGFVNKRKKDLDASL